MVTGNPGEGTITEEVACGDWLLNIITGADEEDGGEEVAVDNAENEVPGDGLWPAVVLGSPNILLRISAEIMKNN